MVYFGEATAHAAILGVALPLALQASIFAGALAVAVGMAWIVTHLSGRGYAMDTLLGVLAHSSLAIGLVIVSFLLGIRIDLMAYLFGDILAVSRIDLLIIWGGAALVLGLIAWRWSSLLIATLNEELAYASGLNPKRERLILTLSLGIMVAVAIKVVGALLIVAMLIIPTAAARGLARTPEAMAVIAALIGAVSAVVGLRTAYVLDTPAGPFIFQKSGLKPPTSVGKDPTVRRRRSKPLNPSTLVGGGSVFVQLFFFVVVASIGTVRNWQA